MRTIERGPLSRSLVQPNPGWGDLCEVCENMIMQGKCGGETRERICKKLSRQFRKDEIVDLVRLSVKGRETTLQDVRNRDFVEICSAFSDIGRGGP